ncbi:hypothetical protein [Chamaesiphon sp. VAR_69_metabat_338]|uniref:hypothetical protein n=1 Tax=Chamaesiphon sp. VAR_69_metabat_338 TaxID=2964704 RepID=UPI00286E11E8|nr:hypothetical protein [Chamaesiphon sp. VAR_69_metabat_338]
MKFKLIAGSMLATVATLGALQAAPVSAQLVPEPWVTVGSKDGSVSYGAGVKIFDLGAEIATGKGKTGVDVLKFISLPVVSPFVGLGLYGGDVAYSGGVQFSPGGNTFFGVGYHSIRGINGQVGIRF